MKSLSIDFQAFSHSSFMLEWSKSEIFGQKGFENFSFEPSSEYLALFKDIFPLQQALPRTHGLLEKKKKVFTIIRNSPMEMKVGTKRATDYESISSKEIHNFYGNSESKRQYKILSKEFKQEIVSYLKQNGISKTLEVYEKACPSLTRRRLNSWLKNINKPRTFNGKKSHDPKRDLEILDWIKEFEVSMKRHPNRREMKKMALQTSNDPAFKASKGWLDKFCRKHEINLAPIKGGVVSIKKEETFSTSTYCNSHYQKELTEISTPQNSSISEEKMNDSFYNFANCEKKEIEKMANFSENCSYLKYIDYTAAADVEYNFIERGDDEIPCLNNYQW